MNSDTVRKIVALNRNVAATAAMVKRGELSDAEAAILVDGYKAEIGRLRAQGELSLGASPAPSPKPSKGA